MAKEELQTLKELFSLPIEEREYGSEERQQLVYGIESFIDMFSSDLWHTTEHIAVTYTDSNSKYATDTVSAIQIVFYNCELVTGLKVTNTSEFKFLKKQLDKSPVMSYLLHKIKIGNQFKTEWTELYQYGEWFSESATYLEPFFGWEECPC